DIGGGRVGGPRRARPVGRVRTGRGGRSVSTRLTGRAAAPGAALAPAFVVTPQQPVEDDLPKERSGPAEEETARLRAALERAEWSSSSWAGAPRARRRPFAR